MHGNRMRVIQKTQRANNVCRKTVKKTHPIPKKDSDKDPERLKYRNMKI